MPHITQTKEDYLRAIYHLTEQEGDKSVNIVELARYMKLAKSTVSERTRELVAHGFIRHEKYAALSFTKKGRTIAKKITYKHRLIEVFLHDVLKIPKHKVHNEAHALEHAFSDTVIAKLKKFLGNPKYDPHGKLIET